MSDPDQTRIDILVDDLRALLEARGVEAKIVDVLTALVRTGFESGNWRFTDAEPARGPASSPLARQIMAKAFRAVGKKNQNPEFLEAAADLERAAQQGPCATVAEPAQEDRSPTLQPEFTLPHGEELKRAAQIGLAIAEAQAEAENQPDAAERIERARRSP